MKKFFTQISLNWWILVGSVTVFLAISLPALLVPHHQFYNLEPYPDGLWYVSQAWQFAHTGNLELAYQGTNLASRVPPLYPLTLAAGFLIWPRPELFYVTNLVLSLLSLFFLGQIFRYLKLNFGQTCLGFIVYLSHAYIVWLPTFPMAENLSSTLFLAALSLLFSPKKTLKTEIAIFGLVIGLILTKYAYVGVGAAIICCLFYRKLSRPSKKSILLSSIILLATVIILMAWFGWQKINPFDLFTFKTFGKPAPSGLIFYSLNNLIPNSLAYAKMLAGFRTTFLWLHFPFTSLFGLILAGWGIIAAWKSEQQIQIKQLLFILLAHLPLFLIFYVTDARYLIFAIPVISILASLIPFNFILRPLQLNKVAIFIGVLLVAHLLTQAAFYRFIIANNLLGRSRAWQYEAIKKFDTFFINKNNAVMVTALPPFLVQLYSENDYRVLPLSVHQEFINKNQWVWGSDIEYHNLTIFYQKLINQGYEVYISNAYVTHQYSVIQDYESYAKSFDLELVQTGCDNTCNIYKLKSKPD